MKIGVYNAAWGNVGNAFFATGLISLLRKEFPQHTVYELDEPHAYLAPTWNRRSRGHVFPLASIQEADVYVFTGPILAQIVRPHFGFDLLIKRIKEAGHEYMILSASASEMTDEEVRACAEVLLQFPPLAFATRDEQTYERFRSLVPSCHNGICCAFLIPFIDGVADVKRDRPYFISSFYKRPEPYFSVPKGLEVSADTLKISPRKYLFGCIGRRWARHLEFLRAYPSSLNGVDIVRVHQGFNPATSLFNYAQPNSFVSYNPRSYLSVYKGCEFVVFDRVHACAAALAYGHPARLLDINDRMGIFARMGISRDSNGVMRPLARIQYEKVVAEYVAYLRRVLDERNTQCPR